MFIFVTICMFMAVPSHLRMGKVDTDAFAQGERDAGSNALRNYEVTEEDGGEAGVGVPDLAVVEQPQEELAADAMESKDDAAQKKKKL